MREEAVTGFTGQVELDVIRVAMELYVVFTENIAKGEDANNEEVGAQDRTLGYTSGYRGRMGNEGFELNKLSVA